MAAPRSNIQSKLLNPSKRSYNYYTPAHVLNATLSLPKASCKPTKINLPTPTVDGQTLQSILEQSLAMQHLVHQPCLSHPRLHDNEHSDAQADEHTPNLQKLKAAFA